MQLRTKHQDILDCFQALTSAELPILQGVYEKVQHNRRTGLALQFTTKCLFVMIDREEDTIDVRCDDDSSLDQPGWTRLENHKLWQPLLRSTFGSGWATINPQGRCDGILLRFQDGQPIIGLAVLDSAITFSRVLREQEAAGDRCGLRVGPEHTPVRPFQIPFPSPRRASLRPREQAFRNPWSERGAEPPARMASKTGSFAKAIVYTFVGGVCCALVAAESYGLGHLIGLQLGHRSLPLIDAIEAVSKWTGWGWIGAAVGGVVGLGVGVQHRKPIGLGFVGAILGAIVFMMDNPKTADPMDALVNWAIIAGTGGLIAYGTVKVVRGLKKQHADEGDGA